jgi:hypothetical protein
LLGLVEVEGGQPVVDPTAVLKDELIAAAKATVATCPLAPILFGKTQAIFFHILRMETCSPLIRYRFCSDVSIKQIKIISGSRPQHHRLPIPSHVNWRIAMSTARWPG